MAMNGLVPDEGQKFQAAMQGLMAMFQQMSKQGAPASTPRPSGMSAMGAFGPANASALDKYRQGNLQDFQFAEMQRKQGVAKAQAEARARLVTQVQSGAQGPMSGAVAADAIGAGSDPLATYRAMQTEPKKPFTLSQGAQRFDASGNAIASVPPKADKPPGPSWKKIVDRNSLTGFSYQDMNNPKNIRPNAEPKTGMEVITADGTVVRVGGSKGMSGSRRDEVKATGQNLRRNITAIDRVLDTMSKTPSTVGAVGALKGIGQTALSIGKDVVAEWSGVVNDDIKQGLADSSWGFDPNLPKMKVLENMLAYALARANKPYGRLNKDDKDAAMGSVKIQGLTSSADVQARLTEVRERLVDAEKDIATRLGIQPGEAIPAYRKRLRGMSDDEILKGLGQ